jgi:hypothetical protein
MRNSQSKSNRLARLFEAYASNLSICDPALQNVIACPLCLRKFTLDALESKILTEEHIISRELGGKLVTLTCKECNSSDGSELDSNLINEFRALDGLSGLSGKPFKGRVKMRDAKQDVEIYFSTGKSPKIRLVGDKQRVNPASAQAIMQALEKEPKEVSFQVDFGYSPQKANVAKLRAAYLLMFRYFGYEYILHESLKEVRQQILSPGQDIIASKASIAFKHDPEELNSIGLIRSPSELRAFIVSFKVSTAIDRSFGVILPGFSSDSNGIYDRWSEKSEALKDSQMDITYILQNPNAPPGYIYQGVVTSAWDNI